MLNKLLEQDPYADADDSFFEEQEYTTVSALLGERAKPFLGIPIGPLQVGHFTGALVIVLMAFIEYPGFPLTNLPSPIRGALQGGKSRAYVCFLCQLSSFMRHFIVSEQLTSFSLLCITSKSRSLLSRHFPTNERPWNCVWCESYPGIVCYCQGRRKRSTAPIMDCEGIHCWWLGLRPTHPTTYAWWHQGSPIPERQTLVEEQEKIFITMLWI